MNKAKLEKVQQKNQLKFQNESYLDNIDSSNLALGLETHEKKYGKQGSKAFSRVNEI